MEKIAKPVQVKKYRNKPYRDRTIAKWGKVSRETTLQAGSFWAYMVDMYADPSDVKLRLVTNGNDGFLQDKARIKGYFVKALKDVDLDRPKK